MAGINGYSHFLILDVFIFHTVTSAVDAPLTSAVDAPITSAVDAPITSAVDAPITSAVDAPVTSAVDAPALTTDLIHYFGFEGEEGYSSEEPSDDDFTKKRQCQSVKDQCLEEAQRDPHWAAVTTDFPMAFLGIPGPQEHILSIIQEAQKKHRVYCSGLEHYVLERWSSAPPGPPGYPKRAKKHCHSVNADQGPRAPGMRPSMDPLKAGHGLVLPSGEKSTLSLSATVLSTTMLSVTVLSVTVLSMTVLSETVLSETVLSAIALLPCSSLILLSPIGPSHLPRSGSRHPLGSPRCRSWSGDHRLYSPGHHLPSVHHSHSREHHLYSCGGSSSSDHALHSPAHDRHSGDRLPSLGPHLCSPMHHSPPLASPHVPPPDRDFPSVQGLHHDRPEPENAMLEDQAPEAQTVSQLPGPVSSDHDHDTSMQVDVRQVGLPVSPKDSPIIPLSEFNDLDIWTDDNGQPGTESNETAKASPVNLDPPIFVGNWFRIKFSGITGDVNIREVFEHLSEDHLFGVRVWKNKGGKGLACLKKKVMLAFKSQPRQDAMLSHFRNSPGSRLFDFEEATKIAVVHQESIASF
ncbi:hypothetical protein BS47DRAFT_1393843 [Hydnum rufescens UP504]|uniref:Uncharacterized protein n=1 Tax=Hydnum rufescens UP504 TaxID=1448309 RepID=A0A9P6DVM0_9AGAM|nr:hypothetical protein BS47DRAFT_1393843 [Hydnum rufescens UP504]